MKIHRHIARRLQARKAIVPAGIRGRRLVDRIRIGDPGGNRSPRQRRALERYRSRDTVRWRRGGRIRHPRIMTTASTAAHKCQDSTDRQQLHSSHRSSTSIAFASSFASIILRFGCAAHNLDSVDLSAIRRLLITRPAIAPLTEAFPYSSLHGEWDCP
jgi:hypothetical protein